MSLPRPGDVVGGKYRVIRELGKGGMATVYEAEHVLTGKRVAVKWMAPGTLQAKEEARFLREARAAARVKHPNVVDVYDVGHEGHLIFIVMEYLEGEPLSDLLERGDTPLAEVLALLVQVMRGVAAVHAVGVVHRDLKPENILLARQPHQREPLPKLLDFGIACFDDPMSSRITKPGVVLGTAAYMSVEQVRGARDIDARSDVYALGVILYEAITGRRPFEADGLPALLTAVLTLDPVPPRAYRPDLPLALEQAVLAALVKDRDKRTPSVEALARAIEPFAAGSGRAVTLRDVPGTLRDSAATPARRPSRRILLALAALTGLVVFSLSGLAAAGLRTRPQSVPPLPVFDAQKASLTAPPPPVVPEPLAPDAGHPSEPARPAQVRPRPAGPGPLAARKLPPQTKLGELTPEQFELACDQALGSARVVRRALTRFRCTTEAAKDGACDQKQVDACIMNPPVTVRAAMAETLPNDCGRILRTDCPEVTVDERLGCLRELARSFETAYGALSCTSPKLAAAPRLSTTCPSLEARCPSAP